MTGSSDPIQIREDIETTREQLGETVEALAAKTDVTGQARRKLERTTAQVAETASQRKPGLLVVGALGLTVLLLRRRASR